MKITQLFINSKLVQRLIILFLTVTPIQKISAQLHLSIPQTELKEVINQIQSQSRYQFFYDDRLSTTSVGPLTVSNASLESILGTLLKDKNISFKVEDHIVYLLESPIGRDKPTSKKQIVRGLITDDKGIPLTGVNISIKDMRTGSVSDIDGNYQIAVDTENPILVFSYIGYKTLEAPLKGKSFLSVILQEDFHPLDMVVITALGIKRQEKALSYNTQNIKQNELTKVKDANFINSLNGKVAGVKIQSSSSGIGGATKVVMRGTKSIEGNNNAIYVIDGIPMYNTVSIQGIGGYSSRGSTEAIADLNPEDIESITILTGASAAALYGSSAANGAILITTKRGKEGKMEIGFTSFMEFGKAFVMPDFQNTYGSNPNEAVSWGNKQISSGYTPEDFFKTAATYTNSLTLSMGSKQSQTYASIAATNARGLIPNNNYDRYNMTLHNSNMTLNGKVKTDIGVQYIIQRDQNMVNQGEYMNPLVGAYLYPRGLNWKDARYFEQWDEDRDILTASPFPEGEYTMQNPYWAAYRNIRTSERKRFIVSLGVSYNIKEWTPSEKWDISARYRIDHTSQEYEDKRFVGTITTLLDGGTKNGYFGLNNNCVAQNYVDILSNFNKNFGENWGIATHIGASLTDLKNDGLVNQGPLRDDGLPNIFNVQNIEQKAYKAIFYQEGWHEQTQSIFGSMEINWKHLLYLTMTGRNDWASQLAGSNHKSFFYPSVGLTGIITDMLPENVKKSLYHTLSFAKVRLAFAQVASPFKRELTIPMNTFSHTDKKWIEEGYYPLKDLQPERTNSFEIGLNTKWLKNKLNFDITYYHTQTKNQTIHAPMSPSSGYNYTYVQTGNVQNQGVEIILESRFNIIPSLSWSSSLNFDYNKNKIKELVKNVRNPQKPESPLFKEDELLKDNFGNAQIILRPGGTLGEIYAKTDFVRDTYGIIDISQDLKPRNDYLKLGSLLPKTNLSWKNDFSYKQLSFGFMLSARLGGIVISGTQAAMDYSGVSKLTADMRDIGGVEVDKGIVIPVQKHFQLQGRPKDFLTQYYTYSATNIRLREAYIAFNIPRKWLSNILDLTVSLTGKNLWMIYNKAPFDPETIFSTDNYAQGLDYFMTPSIRSLGFNIKMKF